MKFRSFKGIEDSETVYIDAENVVNTLMTVFIGTAMKNIYFTQRLPRSSKLFS